MLGYSEADFTMRGINRSNMGIDVEMIDNNVRGYRNAGQM